MKRLPQSKSVKFCYPQEFGKFRGALEELGSRKLCISVFSKFLEDETGKNVE